MNPQEFGHLVNELVSLPGETEWVEFKHNNGDPQDIGEYISAIANSAALHGKDRGYVLWGIEDESRRIVGTTFRLRQTTIGAEELENWLATQLHPGVNFHFHGGEVQGAHLELIEVPAATHTPVRFKDFDYIRVGTYKKKLRDFSEKERDLWLVLRNTTFEAGIIRAGVSGADVLDALDAAAYFVLTQQPQPQRTEAVLERLVHEKLLVQQGADLFDIRNVAAVLFAKDLSTFGSLGRKVVRVVTYEGAGRTRGIRERVEPRGYAAGFQGLLDYIDTQVPRREHIEHGLRQDLRAYPQDTIREPLGNALIHQDFLKTGTGPMVEIFIDRIEITNPGTPLVTPDRFLDAPPRSRNEVLAALMRRMRICEERGSGIDKVVQAVETSLLPAPEFLEVTDNTRVILLGPRSFANMTKAERIRACYQHACLQFVSNQRLTNSSLRKRFGITDDNYATASRVIADAIEAKLIKPFDPVSASRKHSQYVPYWA